MIRCHVLASGLVQGVFFRAFTQESAEELGLTGFVRNLPDDRVEAVIEGDEAKIKKLLDILKKGPSGSHVNNLDVRWEEARNEFDGFEVRT